MLVVYVKADSRCTATELSAQYRSSHCRPSLLASTYERTADGECFFAMLDSRVPWSKLILPVVLPVVTAPTVLDSSNATS